MIYDTLIIAGAILGIGGISYLTWYLLPRPGAHRGPKRPPAAAGTQACAWCTPGADGPCSCEAFCGQAECWGPCQAPELSLRHDPDETAFLPAPAGPGEWLPRTPQLDDTVRYLADVGCLDPETEIEQARLREALSGADSHVRTDASAPGWLGASGPKQADRPSAGPIASHRSPDWREQTAIDLDPVTLAGQAAVLPPALASVPLVDEEVMPHADDAGAHMNVSRPGQEQVSDGPSGIHPVPSAGPGDLELLALTAAPECSCVLGNEPLTATTPIAACPARHDDDAEPPDPGEWAFQQAKAYVLSVAEQEARAADEALDFAAETGFPQSQDPVWPPWVPWLLLEDEAERLVIAG